MSYRKFSAQQLFTGSEMLTGDYVLITSEEGVVEQIVSQADAGEGVEQMDGILSPCFINAHCHLELSHLKGKIPEGTGMLRFISAIMNSRQGDTGEMLSAMDAAETEMLENGIIATGDICNTSLSLTQKKKGRMYYHNFLEVAGFDPLSAGKRFDAIKNVFAEFAVQYGLPIESNSIVPHAPYSVSETLFHSVVSFPGNHVLSMHNQESVAEDDFFRAKQGDFLQLYKNIGLDISVFESAGKSSLQKVLPFFKKNQTLILVHNVTTNREDLDFIKAFNAGIRPTDIYLCLCPNANEYIGNGLPDVNMLFDSGINIVIGTDSLASNHALSILDEIKCLRKKFPKIAESRLLQSATLDGARALQLDEVLGSFEKGKQPGVIIIRDDFSSVERLV